MVDNSPRITRLCADVRAAVPGALDEFWHEVTAVGTPLVEPADAGNVLVTFLWRGEAESTSLLWGLNAELTRLDGTDLWYATQTLPSDLRTVYFFGHAGADKPPRDASGAGPTHVDACNTRPFKFPGDPVDPADHDQWMSLLELPTAPAEDWLGQRDGVPPGSMLELDLDSAALSGARRIAVYQPAGYAGDENLPALVVFDGFLSRTVLRIPTTLDNLIAAGRIPPLMAFFVTSTNDGRRDDELRPGDTITDFTVGELMPWARKRWSISTDPADCVVAGASRGGLAAAYVGLSAPDVFGAVISQSGSFWWPSPSEGEPEWLTREYASRPRAAVRFYLDVGTRETMPGPGGGPSQVDVNRRMRDTLRQRGYPVTYAEYTGGHDYVNWRRTFGDALLAIFADRR